jgi:DNA-binding transcriptional LysR family regulator
MNLFESMRAFVRVAEAGSFSRAADSLAVTTAQISRAVTRLEAHLQTRLIQRTSRRMSLTEAGEQYLMRCEEILSLVRLAEAEVSGSTSMPSGRLRIHATIAFGQHYLAPLIAEYQQVYSEVRVDLILGQRVPDMIEEGFDLSVVVAHALPDSAFISQQIGAAYAVLCASPQYVAKHGLPDSIDALHDHACLQLLLGDMPPGQWIFNDAQATVFRHQQSVPFSVNLADAMAQSLCKGMGIGPLPVRLALPHLRDGSLVRVLPALSLRSNNIFALYPSRHYLDAKVRSFVAFLREKVPMELSRDEENLRDSGVAY